MQYFPVLLKQMLLWMMHFLIRFFLMQDFSGSLKCKNTLCNPVKEIPVMGYRDDYSVIAIQIIL